MKHATIDFETRSELPIKVGAYKYAESPTTTILSLAYQLPGDTTTYLWTPDHSAPQDLLDYVYLGGLVEAHNSFFEHCVWNRVAIRDNSDWPPMPLHQWRCSMAKTRAAGLPGSLDLAGDVLSLDIQKDKRGKYLINKLCKPRKPSKNNPDKWVDDPALLQELYDYNVRDVDAEIELSNTLPALSDKETEVWLLDQKINERGIFIDAEAVNKTIQVLEQTTKRYNRHLKMISQGAFHTGNQRDKILAWCKAQGVELPSLTKVDVIATLKRKDLPHALKDVLTIRQMLSKTSTAKYKKMLDMRADDGRIHEVLQYHKAHTGRFSGAGLQIQNLPRPTIDEDPQLLVDALMSGDLDHVEEYYNNSFEVASSAIRSMIITPPGKKLIAADYGAIETRVLMWLADVKSGLDIFAKGECMYCHMAALIYGLPWEEIFAGYKKEDFKCTNMRAIGKAAVLGLGYQMGAKKFRETCELAGIDISEEMAQTTVDTYRNQFSKVTKLWNGLEDVAVKALLHPGKVFKYGRIKFKKKGLFLLCRLPSSRRIHYPFARLADVKTPWGETKTAVHYQTYKEGKWLEVSTYSGKILENVTQAIARDIMVEAMLRLEDGGYPVIMSVHDEAVSEVPENFSNLQNYINIMCAPVEWAKDLPLKASGWEGQRYRK